MFAVLKVGPYFVDYVDGRYFLVSSWESAIPHNTVAEALNTYTCLPMEWRQTARIGIVSENRCYELGVDVLITTR